MASLLSILKTVLNLNSVHVENQNIVTVQVRHFGELHDEQQLHVHLRPIRRYQGCCPECRKKCPGYDFKSTGESKWRAANLNGIPVYLFYQRCRIQCPEHGVLAEWLPWTDGNSRFTESFNNEVAWMALQMSKLAVSTMAGINWRTVGNCIKTAHDSVGFAAFVLMRPAIEKGIPISLWFMTWTETRSFGYTKTTGKKYFPSSASC